MFDNGLLFEVLKRGRSPALKFLTDGAGEERSSNVAFVVVADDTVLTDLSATRKFAVTGKAECLTSVSNVGRRRNRAGRLVWWN